MDDDSHEQVLYYGLDDDNQESKLHQLLTRLHLGWRKIESDELNNTIGELAGFSVPGSRPAFSGPAPKESVAILHGLTDNRINELLANLRKTSGLRIDLKAVVTENNQCWTIHELIAELRNEHAVMKMWTTVQAITRQGEAFLATQKTGLSTHSDRSDLVEQLQGAVLQARDIMVIAREQGDIDLNQLRGAGQAIANLLKAFET